MRWSHQKLFQLLMVLREIFRKLILSERRDGAIKGTSNLRVSKVTMWDSCGWSLSDPLCHSPIGKRDLSLPSALEIKNQEGVRQDPRKIWSYRGKDSQLSEDSHCRNWLLSPIESWLILLRNWIRDTKQLSNDWNSLLFRTPGGRERVLCCAKRDRCWIWLFFWKKESPLRLLN